jgi:hypothetical protein
MKHLIVILVMCFALTMPCESKIVKTGNQWIEVVDSTKTKSAQPDKAVGTFTKKVNGKNKTYIVYQGKRGGFYYINDKGKKVYLPKK